MSYVQTIGGRIKPEEMGLTYTHEHLYSNPPQWVKDKDPDLVLQDIGRSRQELMNFIAAGGNTLVDMTAVDYGRNIEAVKKITAGLPVHVIVTTGFNKGLFFNRWVYEASQEELTAWMIREVTEGIEGTDLKAGVIKLGTGYNHISEVEKKTIMAAAAAHLETGAPISTHTEAGTMALEQLALLKKAGVDLNHVIIGHADRNLDVWYFKKIAAQGAYIEFDGLSKVKYYPDSMRVEAIIALIRAGYGHKILFSGDMARQSYLEAYGGGPGFRFIIQKFLPRLEEELAEAGLDPAWAKRILTTNAQQAFTFKE